MAVAVEVAVAVAVGVELPGLPPAFSLSFPVPLTLSKSCPVSDCRLPVLLTTLLWFPEPIPRL